MSFFAHFNAVGCGLSHAMHCANACISDFASLGRQPGPMTIKESSDEFNPPTIDSDAMVIPRPARSGKDLLALIIATCGVGYFPLAPGTWGSLLAVAFYLVLRFSLFGPLIATTNQASYSLLFIAIEVLIIGAVTFVGIWAASRTERLLRLKDPGKVVVDEVAGQLIALVAVPSAAHPYSFAWVVVAFILFRFFDIVKPYPARKFEALHGGLGIMADDLVAGAYAGVIVSVVVALGFG